MRPIIHAEAPRSPWVDGSSWLPEVLTGTFRVRHAPGGLVIAHGVLTVTASSGARSSVVPREFRPAFDAASELLVRYGTTTVLGQLGISPSGTVVLYQGVPDSGPARFFTVWSV